MKVLQKLLSMHGGKKNFTYDDAMGFLTKDDMKKLKEATTKPRSPHRKTTCIKWICAKCSKSYFYRIARCPACESRNVKETEMPTNYQNKDIE